MNNIEEKILVIIPTYNEVQTIASVIKEIREALPEADIVIIDGYSKDGTDKKAKELGVSVLQVPYSIGIGGAIETGLKFAAEFDYDILVRVDGDGQHDPSESLQMIKIIKEGKFDVVIGSRFLGKQYYKTKLLRTIAIKTFSFIDSRLIKQKVTDPSSGFQVYNKNVIEFLGNKYCIDYSEVEMLVILYRMGFKIKEISVLMRERREGSSSFSNLRSFIYVFRGILTILVSIFQSFPKYERIK